MKFSIFKKSFNSNFHFVCFVLPWKWPLPIDYFLHLSKNIWNDVKKPDLERDGHLTEI